MTEVIRTVVSGAGGGSGADAEIGAPTIGTRNELLTISTTPPPTLTVDTKIILTDHIQLLSGETVVETDNGEISSIAIGCGGLIGDVDAPLLSGSLRCDGLDLTNVNTGANAYHYKMTGSTRDLQLYECRASGAARGILVENVSAGGIRGFIHTAANERAIVIDGTIGRFVATNLAVAGQTASWIGVELTATATVNNAIALYSSAIGIGDPGHRGVRLADAATFTADAHFIVAGLATDGDQAQLFDQSAGSMPLGDLRLIVDGSTAGNWTACFAVKRTDLANPLLVSYPAFPAAAPTPFPYKDGVNPPEIDNVETPVRWRIVKDDPAPGDWYMEYLGPKVNALHDIKVEILVDRNANTRAMTMLIEKALAATPTTWVIQPATVRHMDNTNAFRQQLDAGGQVVVSPGDRLRPASEPLEDAVEARLYDVVMTGAT